jgi:hypothetical protein
MKKLHVLVKQRKTTQTTNTIPLASSDDKKKQPKKKQSLRKRKGWKRKLLLLQLVERNPNRLLLLRQNSHSTTTTNALEHDWERATAAPKAQLWHQQFKHMKTFLNTQAYNICMATSALETLTSTKLNRAHYLATFMAAPGNNGRKQHKKSSSQELGQTLLRLAMGKWKIRDALQSLESIRKSCAVVDNCLLDEWCCHLFQ